MKIKPIRFKPIKVRFNFDTDRDRVMDWKDCAPFNPKRQHWGPSEYVIESEDDLLDLYNDIEKTAFKKYNSGAEAKKIAKSIASRVMEQKRQPMRGGIGVEEELFPSYFKVKYYIPVFSETFTQHKKTYLDIWDTSNDVHFFVDVSGYIHDHMSFKYSGPVGTDIYHVRGKRLYTPKFILAITGIDREKLGNGFDKFFQFVSEEV